MRGKWGTAKINEGDGCMSFDFVCRLPVSPPPPSLPCTPHSPFARCCCSVCWCCYCSCSLRKGLLAIIHLAKKDAVCFDLGKAGTVQLLVKMWPEWDDDEMRQLLLWAMNEVARIGGWEVVP